MFVLKNGAFPNPAPPRDPGRMATRLLRHSSRHSANASHRKLTNLTVGKLIFGGAGNQEVLIEVPQGQLYLVRPLSPKGYSELIFKDASVRIRRTAQDFQYQIVVQRVYEEGEAELLAEEQGEDAELDALESERDEKTFLLDEELRFRAEIREGTDEVLAWRDLSGDTGDVYEFVCDSTVDKTALSEFDRIAKECQYERKYRKPHTTASDEDLEQFEFHEEHPIPPASPLQGPQLHLGSADAMIQPQANTAVKREPAPRQPEERYIGVPTSTVAPTALDTYAVEPAELHFFDFAGGAFMMQDDEATATIMEVGKWQYWLQIDGKKRSWLGIPIVSEINPVFNFDFLSVIFNQFTEDGKAYSWLLRFKDQATMERFQEAAMRCLWEQLNEVKWSKMKDVERDYVTDAFADLNMEDVPEEEEVEESEDEEDEEIDRKEKYDEDEEEYDEEDELKDKDSNSLLAVGYKNDRSFVVRGSKIGVFKHNERNKLEFATTISKVSTPNGKLFSPKKVMLHNEDRNLVLQHDTDPSSLYRMDLEYGKVVDEWKVHDDIPVISFAPDNKFAQMTHEQTFVGLSNNSLFRVDPRLSGQKLVDSQLKQYATKNDFSAATTTGKGYIAVASNKGDIRLFDRLGINAKTHIPALGEPIIGLDVSADGRWVLGTCRTYLLLIDAMQSSGKNEGKLGFEKAFSADSKPQPRRLALTPEHVAQFAHETGQGVHFTPARFNTGEDSEETSIITATGPYIIEWNLKKILKGQKGSYLIKRYAEDIKADEFKYGTDKNVIVALPNQVDMIGKKALKRPTRQSIAGGARLSMGGPSGRRSSGRIGGADSGRYKLGKDDIVATY